MSFYLGSKILFFLINLIIFAPLIVATVVLLLKKRKKQCITAGFLYLIGGVFIWLVKLIYFIYLLLTNEIEQSFKLDYGKYFAQQTSKKNDIRNKSDCLCFFLSFLI